MWTTTLKSAAATGSAKVLIYELVKSLPEASALKPSGKPGSLPLRSQPILAEQKLPTTTPSSSRQALSSTPTQLSTSHWPYPAHRHRLKSTMTKHRHLIWPQSTAKLTPPLNLQPYLFHTLPPTQRKKISKITLSSTIHHDLIPPITSSTEKSLLPPAPPLSAHHHYLLVISHKSQRLLSLLLMLR